jgi:hypothetical protein
LPRPAAVLPRLAMPCAPWLNLKFKPRKAEESPTAARAPTVRSLPSASSPPRRCSRREGEGAPEHAGYIVVPWYYSLLPRAPQGTRTPRYCSARTGLHLPVPCLPCPTCSSTRVSFDWPSMLSMPAAPCTCAGGRV